MANVLITQPVKSKRKPNSVRSKIKFLILIHSSYRCETCAPGYYGNAKLGTPLDCKRCACPSINDENNFSSMCQLRDSSFEQQNEVVSDYSLILYQNNDYICTECPEGYIGDHCERYTLFFFENYSGFISVLNEGQF